MAMIISTFIKYEWSSVNISVPIDDWLITNHMITMFTNNAFLIYSFVRTAALERVIDQVIVRIKEERAIAEMIKISCLDILLYISLTYLILLAINSSSIMSLGVVIIFLAMNICLFAIYEILFILTILHRIPLSFALIPFILNILFHYTVIPMIFY